MPFQHVVRLLFDTSTTCPAIVHNDLCGYFGWEYFALKDEKHLANEMDL